MKKKNDVDTPNYLNLCSCTSDDLRYEFCIHGQEVEVIDGIKKRLQQRVSDAFEQLDLLQEARQQLQADLQDKNSVIHVDPDSVPKG